MARSLVPVSVVGCCSVPWFVYSVVGCGLGSFKRIESLNFKKRGLSWFSYQVFSRRIFRPQKGTTQLHNKYTPLLHLYTHFSHRQCTVLQAFWITGVMVRRPNMSFGGAYEFKIVW